jgi:cellulose synthase/poly-beta-1,6-N-acetylglucosamine synthase-like glycosyltransferase
MALNFSLPSISVIVPFLNARQTIIGCLESLLTQSYKGSIEIILVDNNSNDGSLEEVERYLDEKNLKSVNMIPRFSKKGVAAARNAGLKEAKGEILAFTDADCTADKNWIKDLVKGYIDNTIGAVAGGIKGYEPGNIVEKFSSIFTLKSLPHPGVFDKFTLLRGGFATANFSVRHSVIDKIGTFDENIKYWSDDYDLCARIYKNGYKINYVSDALIYHHHRSNLKGLWKQAFRFGGTHSVLLSKHFEKILILELPGFTFQNERVPLKAWIDFASLDKKIAVGLVLSFFYPVFLFILIAYLVYLIAYFYRKTKESDLRISFYELPGFIFLMFLKSLSMTLGRARASLQEKVVCF